MNGEIQVTEDVPAAFAGLVRQRRPRSIALSGGSTARRAYAHLAMLPDLDWADVQVLLGDERWVPVEDEDSNEGMARRVLLDQVGAPHVHSAREAGPTLEEAAEAYDRLIADRFPVIELVHLGLGADGHVASLFPGTAALDVTDRMVVANGDDVHEHPRLTLTFPAIQRARLVVVTVSGEEKAGVLARVAAGQDLPGSRVRAEELVWLVDPAAAAGLDGPTELVAPPG